MSRTDAKIIRITTSIESSYAAIVGILPFIREVAMHEISDLKRFRLKSIEVTFKDEPDESIFRLDGVRKIEKNANAVRLLIDSNINGILRIISEYPIDNISCGDASLEDIFLEYYTQ